MEEVLLYLRRPGEGGQAHACFCFHISFQGRRSHQNANATRCMSINENMVLENPGLTRCDLWLCGRHHTGVLRILDKVATEPGGTVVHSNACGRKVNLISIATGRRQRQYENLKSPFVLGARANGGFITLVNCFFS